MAWNTFVNGTVANAGSVNNNYEYLYNDIGLAAINGSARNPFSKGGNGAHFDNYQNISGLYQTIEIHRLGSTTAVYFSGGGYTGNFLNETSGNLWVCAANWVNSGNAYDGNNTTFTYWTPGSYDIDTVFGKQFSPRTIRFIKYSYHIGRDSTSANRDIQLYLRYATGSKNWSTISTLYDYNGTASRTDSSTGFWIGSLANVSGIALEFDIKCYSASDWSSGVIYEFAWGGSAAGSGILHFNVPAGVFPSDTTKSIFVPQIGSFTSDSDIQYRLISGATTTGWFPCGSTPVFSTHGLGGAPTSYEVMITSQTNEAPLSTLVYGGYLKLL